MPRCLLWKRVPGYTIPMVPMHLPPTCMAPMNLVEQINLSTGWNGKAWALNGPAYIHTSMYIPSARAPRSCAHPHRARGAAGAAWLADPPPASLAEPRAPPDPAQPGPTTRRTVVCRRFVSRLRRTLVPVGKLIMFVMRSTLPMVMGP
jgi:hypothetical protein